MDCCSSVHQAQTKPACKKGLLFPINPMGTPQICDSTSPIFNTQVQNAIQIYKNGDFGFIAGVEFTPAVTLGPNLLTVTLFVPEGTQVGKNDYTSRGEPISGVAVFVPKLCPTTLKASVIITVGNCSKKFEHLDVHCNV